MEVKSAWVWPGTWSGTDNPGDMTPNYKKNQYQSTFAVINILWSLKIYLSEYGYRAILPVPCEPLLDRPEP